MRYCHIVDGAIAEGPGPLPTAWRNISGLDKASPERLLELGWLAVETTEPAFDPATEILEGPTLTILADKVTEVFTKRALTPAEIRDRLPSDQQPKLQPIPASVNSVPALRDAVNSILEYLRGSK